MNYKLIIYILGWMLRLEAGLLLLPFLVGLIYHENSAWGYLITAALCLVIGYFMARKKPAHRNVYMREGFTVVGLTWLVLSLLGALPFVISGEIPNYFDALFETVSGFTTTGSSILTDVEALTHASLFWRSFTHWIGGMGVVVFVLSIVPLLGGSTMNLMRAESPGPVVEKMVPTIRGTAGALYRIYFGITIIEIIVLIVMGMPAFDSLCTTFGTVGTGGFGIKNDSMAGYSAAIQITVTIFMIACGVNFSFYFYLIRKKLKAALRMEEVMVYFAIIIAAVVLITVNISGSCESTGEAARQAFFQVGSIITTTGYSTTDFQLWPQMSQTILVILMLIGACAGSTGGGIKVSRILILFKSIRKELEVLIHPRLVRKIKVNGSTVSHESIRSTNVFIAVYFMIFFLSVLLISIDEFDFTTNFTAVAATLNNIGPGLNAVGPTANFAAFSPFSKIVLIFDMLAGRLEIFPILLLFSPRSWKKYN